MTAPALVLAALVCGDVASAHPAAARQATRAPLAWEARRAVALLDVGFAWSREVLTYDGPGGTRAVREVFRPGLGVGLAYRLRELGLASSLRGVTRLAVDWGLEQGLTFLSARQEVRWEPRLGRGVRLGLGLSASLALALPRPELSFVGFGVPLSVRVAWFEVVAETGFTVPSSSEERAAFAGTRRRGAGPELAPLLVTLRFYLPPASF